MTWLCQPILYNHLLQPILVNFCRHPGLLVPVPVCQPSSHLRASHLPFLPSGLSLYQVFDCVTPFHYSVLFCHMWNSSEVTFPITLPKIGPFSPFSPSYSPLLQVFQQQAEIILFNCLFIYWLSPSMTSSPRKVRNSSVLFATANYCSQNLISHIVSMQQMRQRRKNTREHVYMQGTYEEDYVTYCVNPVSAQEKLVLYSL